MKPTIIIYLLVTIILGGCVPNAVTYYQPSSDGGHIREAGCVPTASLLDFTLRNSHGHLPIRALADNGSYVNQIALFIFKGNWKTFRFSSTDFRIYDLDKKIILHPAEVRTFSEKGMHPLTTDPYVIENEKLPISEIQITLTEMLPEHFELLSPSIIIDGEEIEFPIIRFEHKVWVGISPFNC